MLFKDLSIQAMNSVIAKYRDPNDPILLDLDEFLYEFTQDGELIEHPEVTDMFGKTLKMGDLVVFPYCYNNSYRIHRGKVIQFIFLKKDGQHRKDCKVSVKWPDKDDLITVGLHGNLYHSKSNRSIEYYRIKSELIIVNDLV